ncbi:MAG: hypothetical protein M1114_02600 [Candidatus Dependentiae bacterium]|nr:hypothetical protein [Candidatus Dependentiae bacterium]
MNIKHIITLSTLLTCAFTYTDTNVATHLNQQTETIDQLEIEKSFETIDHEQNNTNEQSFSKQKIAGIALLLVLHGYMMAIPFVPRQYTISKEWVLGLPAIFIVGLLALLSDRMPDVTIDIPDYISTDSSITTHSTHHTNRSFTDMYPPIIPMTSTYTPPITFTRFF